MYLCYNCGSPIIDDCSCMCGLSRQYNSKVLPTAQAPPAVDLGYDPVPFAQLPYGVPCSEIGGKYVFCRVRRSYGYEFDVLLMGHQEGCIMDLNALTDTANLDEPRFYEVPIE